MKTVEKKIGKFNYQIEQFESVLELSRTNQKRVVTDAWKNEAVSKRSVGGSWYGVNNYQEAYDLLANGWEEQTKKVSSLVDKVAKTGVKSKTIIENSVEGFIPNVPLALLNVPQSMINMKRTIIKNNKVLNIVYDGGVLCGVDSDDCIKAGVNVVNALVNLELSGYRIDLNVLDFFVERSGTINGVMVKVKNSNQSLNLKKMMFPIAHTAWFRVVGFDWQDKTPFNKYMSGRGTQFYQAVGEGLCKTEDMKQLLGENTIYINYDMAKQGPEYIEKILTGKN